MTIKDLGDPLAVSESTEQRGATRPLSSGPRWPRRSGRRRLLVRMAAVVGSLAVLAAAAAAWLAYRATELRTEMTAVRQLAPEFKDQLLAKNNEAAQKTLDQIELHIDTAREAATDPLWKAAGALPFVGHNFSVTTELVLSADDVVDRAAQPMLGIFSSLDWQKMTPVNGKFDVAPLESSSPTIVAAANTVELTHARLSGIDGSGLFPEVARPLSDATQSLDDLRRTLNTAADTSQILPAMMGANGPRNYLILIQNNAEIRATGGLPGALAVLHVEDGEIRLEAQSTGSAMGRFTPPVDVDPEQTQIYSKRLGTFISDVNLTPDFPTAAKAAKSMWEAKYGTPVDGVIAVDPVVLAHILKASGPLTIPVPAPVIATGLPTTLTEENVVKTLLSDVYKDLDSNALQDAYFALASKEVFSALASGAVPGDQLIEALTRSAEENRLHVWGSHNSEQEIIAKTNIGGSISGPAAGGNSFGVFFNDGTGAKMDYYVRRSVQLIQECKTDGYSEVTVRVTTANRVPVDAATSLPQLVTGGGRYGVPAGTVQTNIVVYGPAQAQIETAHDNGIKVPFGSHIHGGRPVGTVTTSLAPGEESTVDFTFGKIVQHTEPKVIVTPTVQNVNDVILDSEEKDCAASSGTSG